MKTKLSLLGMAAAATMLLCACGGGNRFSVSKLKGTYTIYAHGFNTNYDPVNVAGSITLDGKGNVTDGEQDYVDSSAPTIEEDTLTGTISIGNDGRGTLTLTPMAVSGPPTAAPVETFSIVQANTKHLLITEFDNSATSAGSMDLQTSPTTTPAGGNAFALLDNWNLMCFGGVITASNGNVVGEGDDDETGNPNFQFQIVGSVTPPDSYGRGLIDLYDYTYDGNLEFAYYVVGPEAFRLVETDGITTDYYLAGSMFGQGTAAGAFSTASLNGNFAFTNLGPEAYFYNYAAAGQFVADGSSSFSSGVMDLNDVIDPPLLAGDISATPYIVLSDGYGYAEPPSNPTGFLNELGIYMVDPAINIADPNSTTGGGGALMTDLDTASLGIGFAVPQMTSATFSGNYAFNQDGAYATSTADGPFDVVGRIKSNGSSTLTGTADFNDLPDAALSGDQAVSGTFATDPANPGRSTAQVNLDGSATPDNVTLYQANDDLLLHVDTDWDTTNNVGVVATGVLEKQQ